MKYVAIHGALTAVTFWIAVAVSWLLLSNMDEVTVYPLAVSALMMVVLAWFPFVISLNETLAEYRAFQRRRRRRAMRRHATRRVH